MASRIRVFYETASEKYMKAVFHYRAGSLEGPLVRNADTNVGREQLCFPVGPLGGRWQQSRLQQNTAATVSSVWKKNSHIFWAFSSGLSCTIKMWKYFFSVLVQHGTSMLGTVCVKLQTPLWTRSLVSFLTVSVPLLLQNLPGRRWKVSAVPESKNNRSF